MFKQGKLKMKLISMIMCFSLFYQIACSPKMHLTGLGMRSFNLSQNKYTKKKPYIKIQENKKKNLE